MKRARSANRKAAVKSGGAPKNIDEYLAGVPEPGRGTLEKIRGVIRSAAPAEAIEVISYGMPAFKHKDVLVWLAAFSKHCSFFPTATVIEKFRNELNGYVISKGTIQFALNKPLPAGLVKKMVKARVAQMEGKKKR